MKQLVKAGTTSKRLVIFVPDSSSTVGAGLAGLAYNSAGLAWYYWREDTGNAGGTAVTLATATRGTFTSGGFKEIDATNLPGFYEIGVPDAVLATGAAWAVMMLRGATNMAPVSIELQIETLYIQSSITKNTARAGFTFALTNSAGTSVTGATVTATRSLDGASFASCANAVSEIANGWYKIDLAAADLNGNVVALRFAASGAVDTRITLFTQP